jgi:hypothetical protein
VTDQETAAYVQAIDPDATGHAREPRLRAAARRPLRLIDEDAEGEREVVLPVGDGTFRTPPPADSLLQQLHEGYMVYGPQRLGDVWKAFVPAGIESV